MNKKLLRGISVALIVASLAASVYFYLHFPAQVTTHWGISGEPNGTSSKGFVAFFFPFLSIVIFLLLSFIPRIDPHHNRYKEFEGSYELMKVALVTFFTAVYFLIGLNGLGYKLDVSLVISVLLALLFVVMGWSMRNVKKNWFFGIRTPWTMSSDVVWDKTHVIASKIFMACGALMLVSLAFSSAVRFIVLILLVIIAVVVSFVASYIFFRKQADSIS